jgi:LuxR family maltose regulon positive regulatory protein
VRARGELLPASAAGCFEAVATALTVGDQESAGEILAAADDTFAAEGTRGAIQRSLLMAWAAEVAGDHRIALDFAGSALDRAEPEGLVEIFLDAGPVILAMVEELSQVRNGLTEAIRWRRGDIGSSGANSSLPEPLTERELEILAVLPSHSTTAELAGLFFVSANTLKTHIAHIYRKLAVSGRSAAIVRARELGLLDPITPLDRAHG